MRFFLLFLTALMLWFPADIVQAAQYPTRPITIVVPYGPGGVSDLAGRALAAAAQKYLGQPVMVVNKVGAGGVSGSHFVLNSKPDGYTMLLARVGSQSVYPAQNVPNKLYDWDSFDMLTILDENPYVVTVLSSSPYKTMQDLADAIKANPGKLKYSHSGTSTILSLGPQVLNKELGLPLNATVGIPFTSDGDAKIALLGRNVDFLGANLTAMMDQILAGEVRALGVSTKERLKELPDVPTFEEAGFPVLMNITGWSGLYGPKNLPPEVTAVWLDVLNKVRADEKWLEVTLSLGSVPVMNSPEEAKEYVRKQIDVFKSIFADAL